jgi:thymidylate synthase ThyX
MRAFLSSAPEVTLVNAFARPFENAVATARTCYSGKGIITPSEVSGDGETTEARQRRALQRDRIARSTYEAGHHTTLQHAHFQFALSNVSRQFIWSFLHSHPFYNSEQVSQRYVEVRPDQVAVPALAGPALAIYTSCVERQMTAYRRLIDLLTAPTAREYFRIFPARRKHSRIGRPEIIIDAQSGKAAPLPACDRDVKKKAQEIARYVLPVGTFAYLYHTVSGITLLRYFRLCQQYDAGAETREVVERMVEELLRVDPLYRTILEEPLPLSATPEFVHFTATRSAAPPAQAAAFCAEFDRELGGYTSRLVDSKPGNQREVAQAVREVLGLPRAALPDDDAIRLALDPAQNALFGESMNLLHHSKLSRALFHASYTFRKKLSHTADSQDQRHRMTPASRPILLAHLQDSPDYVTPELVLRSAPAREVYETTMARTWEAIGELRRLGVADELCAYLLPNAASVRMTESADLLNLHHKLKSRLCYTAQEEIWRASLDEARQIRDTDPTIGRYLLPPCTLRAMTETRPLCPEGDRYCGIPVWKLSIDQYSRVL